MKYSRTCFAHLFVVVMVLCFGLLHPARAANEKFKPVIVYLSSTNSSDRAFIDAARAGIEKAAKELGQIIPEHRMQNAEHIGAELKRLADSGASPIITLGYQNVMAVSSLAERYPHTRFTVIDGLVPPIYANVQSILFKDHEGAFLVGLIAGKLSKSGHIGFIGGMDIPLIRNFATGFTQGVKYAAPDAIIDVDMVGNTSDAWSNPQKAHALAMKQYGDGAEIIFAAAGGSGLGVLKAASEANKFAIGVDTNQNALYPGYVLTSMVKRVDLAVYDTLKNSAEGKWSPGIKYLGIKEGALDYAVDQNNREMISEKLIEEIATAKDRIISGIITVEMYSPK